MEVLFLLQTMKRLATFINVSIEENYGSALCFVESNVTFKGTTQILGNVGVTGGGISSRSSSINVMDATLFDSNLA